MQYAERLLRMHQRNLPRKSQDIAHDLVYAYKDHAFVIDKGEAGDIFGSGIVKNGTSEYSLGNEIYQVMSYVSGISDIMKHYFYFIGGPDCRPRFQKKSG